MVIPEEVCVLDWIGLDCEEGGFDEHDDTKNTVRMCNVTLCLSLTPSLTGSNKYPRPVYCGKKRRNQMQFLSLL